MKKVKRRRGRRTALIILTVLIVIVACTAGFMFWLYQDKGGRLTELKQSELAKQQAYEESITQAQLPEGWSEATLKSLQTAALGAYDTTILDQISLAESGDQEAAAALENSEGSSLSQKAVQYQTLLNSLSDYPEDIAKLAIDNPDNLEFVLSYKDQAADSANTAEQVEVESFDTIPALTTLDPAWGFTTYNGGTFAQTGSAPTALSMVLIYLKEDPSLTPAVVAEYAKTYGYEETPVYEDHSLFGSAAYSWMVNMTPLPAYQAYVDQSLEQGSICIVEIGDETSSKFIVVEGLTENGEWKILDPSVSDQVQTVNPEEYQGKILSAYAYW